MLVLLTPYQVWSITLWVLGSMTESTLVEACILLALSVSSLLHHVSLLWLLSTSAQPTGLEMHLAFCSSIFTWLSRGEFVLSIIGKCRLTIIKYILWHNDVSLRLGDLPNRDPPNWHGILVVRPVCLWVSPVDFPRSDCTNLLTKDSNTYSPRDRPYGLQQCWVEVLPCYHLLVRGFYSR
jgi:hypothetical protein